MMADSLTHFDPNGQAHMVDVADKPATRRTAVASGSIQMQQATLDIILSGSAKKGDVLGIARIAGIQGAKKTSDWIPLCHPLALTRVAIEFVANNPMDTPANIEKDASILAHIASITCTATAETIGPTGVEMEALCAVSAALLTVYDMCKAIDRGMVISSVRVRQKHGGKSGSFVVD